MGIKHLTTTAYHPATNGQTERYNKTIVSRLRHYVNENQADWDDYLQPLTYAYNLQVHRSTRVSPFALTLSRVPPGPASVGMATSLPQDATTSLPAARLRMRLIRQLSTLQKRTATILQKAQARYKNDFDKKVRVELKLRRGDFVYIDRPPTWAMTQADKDKFQNKSKLMPKTTGPLQVLKATAETATIDEDGISNTVSIDRVTLAPRCPDNDTVSNTDTPTTKEGRDERFAPFSQDVGDTEQQLQEASEVAEPKTTE